nr:heparinase II/III family protein [Helcobacillus sp. ACRRO]
MDVEAARRQDLSPRYRREDVDQLLAGRLQMRPHPAWDLPAEPTWHEDPFNDRNWTFQYHMLRWLEPLWRAAGDGDQAALEMWLTWVKNWAEANPVGASPTEWGWRDMSDGLRARQLCLAVPAIAEHAPQELPWLEGLIATHAAWLADPENLGSANHALHQHDALFLTGVVLDDERYRSIAAERMSTLLEAEYDEEGVNAEGAIAYHVNNYSWWQSALRRFDRAGLPRPSGAERHLSAPEEIAHATRPDGTLVTIGDTDIQAARRTGDAPTDYVASAGAKGEPPADLMRAYRAGYVFGRSGWGSEERPFADHTFYSARFGPARRVHGHADGTSLTFSADGQNWLVDPGKFQYNSNAARDHFIARASHSLVLIDGEEPSQDAVVSLVRATTSASHDELVIADPSYEGVKLERRVVFSRLSESLVVVDRVVAEQEVTAVQRWQMGHTVTAEAADGGSVHLRSADRTACLLWSSGAHPQITLAQEDPFDGWVSVGWRQKEPAPAVTERRTGRDITFITAVVRGGSPAELTVVEEPSGMGEAGDAAVLQLRTPYGTERISLLSGAAQVELTS